MKKSMLTVLFAVSAVMAFAIPAEQARIDVFNLSKGAAPKGSGNVTAFTVADKGTAEIADTPEWFKIDSSKTKLSGRGAHMVFKLDGTDWQTGTVTLTAVGSGRLMIRLMGPYARDPETKQLIKKQVDFKKIVVNGKTVYEGKNGEFLTVWHEKSYRIQKDIRVKDGETVKIEATFRPTQEDK